MVTMRAGIAFLCILLPLSAADDLTKPDKISIHTWVREDFFAGFMAYDSEAFERGIRKLDIFLADHPNDANGLGWKYESYFYRLRKDREANADSSYAHHWAEAQEYKNRALTLRAPADVGPLLLVGGSQIWNAQYAASATQRESLFREGRELLRQVQQIQSPVWESIPPHMRGELWSLEGFASDQIGEREERNRVANEMVTKLKGSLYEVRGRRWLNATNLGKADAMCISCHEPGRLQPTLARLSAPPK